MVEYIFDYNSSNTKYILFWTSMYKQKNWYLENDVNDEEYFKKHNCPVTSCVITSNRSLLPEIYMFDALLFHGAENWKFEEIKPNIRGNHQMYTVAIMEPPYYNWHNLEPDGGVFNWTMTYRLDSDVIWTYGQFTDKSNNVVIAPAINPPWRLPEIDDFHNENLLKIVKRKTKMAAWFVSNCYSESKREDLVKELQKYIQVDIYGKCGTFICPRTENRDCLLKLEDEYQFYLSFENSLCMDYVTEKSFRVINKNIIPIVYGGANYKNILPPHSYINVNDFSTVKELAEFLINLSGQPEEYIKYFWWKKYYKVNEDGNFCNICKKLHSSDVRTKTQFYNNINGWWRRNVCINKPRIQIP